MVTMVTLVGVGVVLGLIGTRFWFGTGNLVTMHGDERTCVCV